MKHYIDAHCHLYNNVPRGACDAVGFIANATCESEWGILCHASIENPSVYPAIGIHPWFTDTARPGWDAQMADLLRAHPCLMVGEIGLDRARGDRGRELDIFMRQMAIAAQFRRTVHLHVVRAWDVILAQLKQMHDLPPVIVMHGFRANADIARALMRNDNVYFSFSECNPAAAIVPMDRILVESDGQSGIRLGDIVRDISGRRDVDMTDIIYNNTLRVIHHGQTA